ncbi:fibroin heavy chain [Colletotrichum higginsianum]|nr:fibroin heavy chain [Colletotrichum higginsianum]
MSAPGSNSAHPLGPKSFLRTVRNFIPSVSSGCGGSGGAPGRSTTLSPAQMTSTLSFFCPGGITSGVAQYLSILVKVPRQPVHAVERHRRVDQHQAGDPAPPLGQHLRGPERERPAGGPAAEHVSLVRRRRRRRWRGRLPPEDLGQVSLGQQTVERHAGHGVRVAAEERAVEADDADVAADGRQGGVRGGGAGSVGQEEEQRAGGLGEALEDDGLAGWDGDGSERSVEGVEGVGSILGVLGVVLIVPVGPVNPGGDEEDADGGPLLPGSSGDTGLGGKTPPLVSMLSVIRGFGVCNGLHGGGIADTAAAAAVAPVFILVVLERRDDGVVLLAQHDDVARPLARAADLLHAHVDGVHVLHVDGLEQQHVVPAVVDVDGVGEVGGVVEVEAEAGRLGEGVDDGRVRRKVADAGEAGGEADEGGDLVRARVQHERLHQPVVAVEVGQRGHQPAMLPEICVVPARARSEDTLMRWDSPEACWARRARVEVSVMRMVHSACCWGLPEDYIVSYIMSVYEPSWF